MRRFRFRLEAVLNYRRAQEEDAERVYLQARALRLATEAEIQSVKETRRLSVASAPRELAARLGHEYYIQRLETQQRNLEVARDDEWQDEEIARLEWIERRKDAEALEKLKSRQREEWQTEADRTEQATLDEWAVTRRLPG